MALEPAAARQPLASFLREALGADCEVTALERLTGGTVQDNWRLDAVIAGESRRFVLRTGRAVGVADSLPAPAEFAVLRSAAAVGVRVPTPVAACADDSVTGAPFFVMEYVEGESRPWKLQRDGGVMAHGDALLEQIGAQLGRLQTIRPGAAGLDALGKAPRDIAREQVATMRAYLDTHEYPHPAIEYALRWLEVNAPGPTAPVLCHGDFRFGNVMIGGGEVRAILDWELSRWGDAHEDLGWFCMRFFRFGRPDLAGGGLGRRAALLRGWTSARGVEPDPVAIRYWDIMANTRWAVVSLQQVARHVSGREPSLELALVGLGTAEMELEALSLIARELAGGGHSA